MSASLTFRTEVEPPEGVTFRHLRAPDDYAAMNALANAVRAAEGEEWFSTVEQFAALYEHLSNSDPARDVLVAEREGRVVGYGRGEWHEELDGTRVYTAVAFADP
ncbi:MAG TPA: hypothetical protein VFK38_09230, partial [Candidatus Limnocylindrales bacterium]|nr:hypothetical protein [Candidatus Limnocylindrales bacterium]